MQLGVSRTQTPLCGFSEFHFSFVCSLFRIPEGEAEGVVAGPEELQSLLHLVHLVPEGGNHCIVQAGQLSLLLWAVPLHLVHTHQ